MKTPTRSLLVMLLLGWGLTALAEDGELTLQQQFEDVTGWALHGFADGRAGWRLQSDDYEEDLTLGQALLQLDLSRYGDYAIWQLRTDFLYDEVTDSNHIDLERGEGPIDLREAFVSISPLPSTDLKIGRQIITWGTGNYLFINDLFPKDWQSFFTGRDTEYLKAPSDAVMASTFSEIANLDVVFTPRFDSDRYITGERLSYYNAQLGRRAGEDAQVETDPPDDWFKDFELATRLYRTISGYELAAYTYYGYWKSPGGFDPAINRATFPRLNVYGASMRGNVLGGIGNVEAGYYDSREDEDGDDPFVRNSEWRWLVGYQREVARDLTVGVQYYAEMMEDYHPYQRSLPVGAPEADRVRHVTTLSVTQQLLSQNLTLSFFGYYSPSDADAYLRPSVSYKLTDRWLVTAGINYFTGKYEHTFFNQFEHNSNAYVGVRCSF